MAEFSEEQIQQKEEERMLNEAKRVSDEIERVRKEEKREENETERINKETERETNEIQRMAREDIRQGFYDGFNDRLDEVDSQLAHITSKILDDFSNIKSNQTFHLEYNKEYILNETISFDDVNNIRIDGNNATIRVKEGNIGFLFNEHCKNIVIENLNFISDNTDIETVAIAFMSIDNNYDKNSACKNIHISNCKFLGGFSASIVANVVTDLTVNNCYFTNNKYLGIEVGTGGYGILTQTCYNVNIFNNEFIASPTDRHAIYISCFSLTNHVMQQNENVRIYNNNINWLLADVGTKHENAISVRSTKNCYIYGNTILGGWGSIAVNPSHGDCNEIKIHHNICKYIKGSSEFDLFGIGSIRADKGHNYKVVNLDISNNYITCEGERTSPITIVDTRFFNVSNNTCIQQSTGGSVVVTDSIYGNINGNYLEGKSGYSYGICFRGTLNEHIQTGNNTFKNNIKENIIQDNSTLNNFKFDGTRKVKIDTNGSTYVVGLEDKHNILSSVRGVDNGCIIEFSKFVDVYNSSFSIAYNFGDIPITYVKIENSNSIRVVMKNFNGDNISCLTSAVTFTVTVSS